MRFPKRVVLPAVLLLLAAAGAPETQPRVRPVVDVRENYLLGGTVNGAWRDGPAIARLLRGGERYRVYGRAAALGEAAGRRAVSYDIPCAETYGLALAPARRGAEVAVGGGGNALPRVPRVGSTTQAAYVQAVREVLVRKGIRTPQVRITRHLRVDLEGDGVEEVVLSAMRGTVSIRSDPGDYSLVLVRKVVGGAPRTIVLQEDVHLRRPPEGEMSPLTEFTVAGVWDLDGDGTMEVVTRARYYEGSWTTVHGIRGARATELARAGCGV